MGKTIGQMLMEHFIEAPLSNWQVNPKTQQARLSCIFHDFHLAQSIQILLENAVRSLDTPLRQRLSVTLDKRYGKVYDYTVSLTQSLPVLEHIQTSLRLALQFLVSDLHSHWLVGPHQIGSIFDPGLCLDPLWLRGHLEEYPILSQYRRQKPELPNQSCSQDIVALFQSIAARLGMYRTGQETFQITDRILNGTTTSQIYIVGEKTEIALFIESMRQQLQLKRPDFTPYYHAKPSNQDESKQPNRIHGPH